MSQRKHGAPVRMRSTARKLHQRTHTQMEEATQTGNAEATGQLGPPLSPVPVPGQRSAASQNCLKPPSSRGGALRSFRAVSTATIFRHSCVASRSAGVGGATLVPLGVTFTQHPFSVTG